MIIRPLCKRLLAPGTGMTLICAFVLQKSSSLCTLFLSRLADTHCLLEHRILVGDDHYNYTMTADEARVQMSIWSIVAAPLIMGNDLRTVSAENRAILLNKEVIAVDQDPLGKAGIRITPKNTTEVWARELHDGSVAVALYAKANGGTDDNCTWTVTAGKYLDGGAASNIDCTVWSSMDAATSECCSDVNCVAFSVSDKDSSFTGCTKNKEALPANGGQEVIATGYEGWTKNEPAPAPATSAQVTVNFADLQAVGWTGTSAHVRDLWQGKDLGVFSGSFSAEVPAPGVVMVKLTAQ